MKVEYFRETTTVPRYSRLLEQRYGMYSYVLPHCYSDINLLVASSEFMAQVFIFDTIVLQERVITPGLVTQ